MNVTVQRGQSLWLIAKQNLPAGSSNADIQRATLALAKENQLNAASILQIGQTLKLPPQFAAVTTATTTDALPRLTAGPTPSNRTPQATRIAQATGANKQLLALPFSFTPAQRVDEGPLSLPSIAGVPVQAVVQRFDGMKSSLGVDSLKTLDVRFGVLTQAQFDGVKASFGGFSRVSYDPARSYTAVHFLPPLLQAVVNQDLEIPTAVELKGTEKLNSNPNLGEANESVDLTMNCHAAAWEAARAYQGQATTSVSIFYGEMMLMDDLFEEGANFKLLGKLDGKDKDQLLQLGIQPGDVVQYHEVSDWARMTNLLHSAVYVGNGLFFEKPNTEGPNKEDETPFRVVTLDMVTKPLSDAVSGKFRLELWRPTTPMKEAKDVFESGLEGEFRDFAKRKGKTLNVELVTMLEQGMAGNIRGDHASALVSVPLRQNADGTTSLG